MAVQELVEIKFRLADGNYIGPNKYSPSSTVGFIKEKIIAQWPKEWQESHTAFASKEEADDETTDKDVLRSGLIRYEGDFFLQGSQAALLLGGGEDCMFHPSEYYPCRILESAFYSLKAVLQICIGWQSICLPAEQSGSSGAP